MLLQLPQGLGDAVFAVGGQAGGEDLDADLGAGRQRLDVEGETPGGKREFGVLAEVIAHDGEAFGVADVDMFDARGRDVGARDNLRGSHQEGVHFRVGQAPVLGLLSRRGPSKV